jgi:hypothetical protein
MRIGIFSTRPLSALRHCFGYPFSSPLQRRDTLLCVELDFGLGALHVQRYESRFRQQTARKPLSCRQGHADGGRTLLFRSHF